MSTPAIELVRASKSYRIYHEKNQDLKRRLLRGRRALYEEFWAVRDVSMTIERGEAFCIVGSNGSGKSTTLKLLAGILQPDEGRVTTSGSVSALLELGAGFHPDLSGRENVFLNGALLGLTRRDLRSRFDDIVGFAGLERFIDNPVKTYSSGMYARLGFSVAINVDPEILLIDEVLAVGDDEFQRRCLEKIGTMRASGKTIVIVSHSLGLVQTLCDRAAWIDHGRLMSIGPAHEVVSDYQDHAHQSAVTIDGHVHSGSGEVRVVSAILRHSDPLGAGTGSKATLAFTLDSTIEDRPYCVGFCLRRTDGVAVCGDDSRHFRILTTTIGRSVIEYDIDRLPLIVGEYDIEVVVVDLTDNHFLDYSNRVGRVIVSHGHQLGQAGVVAFFGVWSDSTGATK